MMMASRAKQISLRKNMPPLQQDCGELASTLTIAVYITED